MDEKIDIELKKRDIIDIKFLREKIFVFLKNEFGIQLQQYLDMDAYIFKFDTNFDKEVKKIDTYINNLVKFLIT